MSEPINDLSNYRYSTFLENLPGDWDQKEISQIGVVVGGGTPSREVPSFWGGSIPWITPSEVSGKNVKLLHDTKEHISESGLAGSGAHILKTGSLLVTTRATLGARAINAVPMATNQGFKSVVFRRPEEASYYFHLFELVKPELVRRASGTTFLEISGSDFGSIKVPSPPQNEKLKIAQVIDNLDIAIHETEAILAKLKDVKGGLLHDLLTRGIDSNGEMRPAPTEALHLYKDSPLGWIPKSWRTVNLNEAITVTLGFAFSSEHYVEDGVFSFRVTNIGRPLDNFGGKVFLPEKFWDSFSKQRLTGGEIVIVMVGATTGKLGRVPPQVCPALQNQNMWKLSPKQGFDTEFMWIALPEVVQRHLALAQGSARDFLTQKGFLETIMVSPPIEEQLLLVKASSANSDRIETEQRLLNSLIELKSGLMDDLLTGRVRVTPLLSKAAEGST